jgi:hypothetical protein
LGRVGHLVEGELDGEAADAVAVNGEGQLQRRTPRDGLRRVPRTRKLRKLLRPDRNSRFSRTPGISPSDDLVRILRLQHAF